MITFAAVLVHSMAPAPACRGSGDVKVFCRQVLLSSLTSDQQNVAKLIALTMEGDYTPRRLRLQQ